MTHLNQYRRPLLLGLPLVGLLAVFGCYNTPVDVSDYSRGPAPPRLASRLRPGRPEITPAHP